MVMTEFFRWLLGYVEFSFSGGFIGDFINECYQQKVNIHNLKRSENTLHGKCLALQYKRLHSIALRSDGVVKITKKRGLLFPILKLKKRSGLIAGIGAFLIIINTLSGFIWNIEITGNNDIKTSELSTILSQNNMHIGSHWSTVNSDTIENIILATFDNCAWAHINRYSSTAVLEIREGILNPKTDSAKGKFNLKATKDGVIVYTNIKRGWSAVKIGDAVTAGDLLASGIYESEQAKINLYSHASGTVLAKVNEPFSLTISRVQKNKIYNEIVENKELNFFGISVPLSLNLNKSQDFDTELKTKYLKLNNNDLPIGITTKKLKYYTEFERELNDKELNNLIQSEIENKIKNDYSDCEIISQNIDIKLNAQNAVASGNVVVIEDIAEEIKL